MQQRQSEGQQKEALSTHIQCLSCNDDNAGNIALIHSLQILREDLGNDNASDYSESEDVELLKQMVNISDQPEPPDPEPPPSPAKYDTQESNTNWCDEILFNINNTIHSL